ncbi:MAG TPA: energy transducer TonB [Vicinamibacterales bacterium]|nr:energy transducer TonB [Vicinamibacterales bacterium]
MVRTAVGIWLAVTALAGAQDQAQDVLTAAPAFAQQTSQPFGRGASRANEPGLVKPKLLKQVPPNYPTVARNASVAGDVEIEAIVLPDGTVGDMRLVKSLDTRFGLDQEAMRVAKLWVFEPGRKDGFPIPVIVTIVVQYRLKADASGRGASQVGRLGVPSATFTASVGPPASGTVEESEEEFAKGAHRLRDPGVEPPKPKKQVPPQYPKLPGDPRPNGVVELDAIVMPDGTIGKVRVAKSMDKLVGLEGFDASAVASARQWVFEPGKKDGVAAPIVVRLMLEFRSRS